MRCSKGTRNPLEPVERIAMDVKLVARTLDLFERFATEQRPLPLTELARLMDVPV